MHISSQSSSAIHSASADPQPIIVFDDACNLCSGAVQFITANDPQRRFTFLSRQSPRAAELLHASGGPPANASIVLLDYGRRFDRSDAVLYTSLRLRWPWPLAFALIALPPAMRDAAYEWIARNRYRWFGRRDVCSPRV